MQLSRYAPLLLIAGLAACKPGAAQNPVQQAFAQRPAVRPLSQVAFRLPATAGTPVKLFRLPRFEEVSRRFDTPGFTTERVVSFSDDDDQVYVLSTRGTLLALDLGTGRGRSIDSGVTAATGGPDGAPYVIHADGSVAAVEHRVAKPWETKLPTEPAALIGAGRGVLLAEYKSSKGRQLLAATPNRPPVTLPLPDGPLAASHWGDMVAVGTDSGIVILDVVLDPQRAPTPRLVKLRSSPVAVAFSASAHRVYALLGGTITVADRFLGDVLAESELPGVGREMRVDPLGRLLLVRPAVGDSIWVVDVGTNRYAGTIAGSWSWDLPAVAPDGSVLTRQGNDVISLAGDSLTPISRVRGTTNDRWLPLAWDPRGPVIDVGELAPSTPEQGSVLYVQVSSSLNEAWSQDFAQNLRRAGLNASVLPPGTPDEGYRVVLGPYPTREAAEAAGRGLGGRYSYWVFSKDQAEPQ